MGKVMLGPASIPLTLNPVVQRAGLGIYNVGVLYPVRSLNSSVVPRYTIRITREITRSR